MAWKLRKEKASAVTSLDEPADQESAVQPDLTDAGESIAAPAGGFPAKSTPAAISTDEGEYQERQPIDLDADLLPLPGGHPLGEADTLTFDDSQEQAPLVLADEEPDLHFAEPENDAFAPYDPGQTSAPSASAPIAPTAAIPLDEAAHGDDHLGNGVSGTRDAIAPGLVHDDLQSGMPKVAPFVLDQPATAPDAPTETEGHRLVLRLGNLSASFPIVKDTITIGRPDSSTQNYPDVEVEIDDGVSRKHAEIRWQGDGYYLVDVGSTNGTILNGEMLQAMHPTLLTHGDRIRIGERTEIVFE